MKSTLFEKEEEQQQTKIYTQNNQPRDTEREWRAT